jgi:hypothetical protein
MPNCPRKQQMIASRNATARSNNQRRQHNIVPTVKIWTGAKLPWRCYHFASYYRYFIAAATSSYKPLVLPRFSQVHKGVDLTIMGRFIISP